MPTQAFQSPAEVDRPRNAEEQIAHLERLCRQQALELDLLRSEVDVLKKRGICSHPTATRHNRPASGADAAAVRPQAVPLAGDQLAVVLSASPSIGATARW